MALSKAALPPPPPPSERDSIGLEANQSRLVSSFDWIWLGLTGEVDRWRGGWFDFSSAPMKVDLMSYCSGRGDEPDYECGWTRGVIVVDMRLSLRFSKQCQMCGLSVIQRSTVLWVSCYILYFRH